MFFEEGAFTPGVGVSKPLILLFILDKKKILSIKTTWNIAITSNISFFNLKRNFETFFELIKICIYYK